MGELLLLYVDDTLDDVTPFGKVRSRAFRIMPADALRSTGKLLTETPVSQLDLRWLAVDQQNGLCTKNLRPLAMALDFASNSASGKVWLGANQHESYWVFDICYNNTSDIAPTTITGG